jgi:hypothetical protein
MVSTWSNLTNDIACNIICPQINVSNFDFIGNDLTINLRHFINDFSRSF